MWSKEARELQRPASYKWSEYAHGPCKPSKAQILQTSVKTPEEGYIQPSSVCLNLTLSEELLKTALKFFCAIDLELSESFKIRKKAAS